MKNFRLRDSVSIIFEDGDARDLHNEYNFLKMVVDKDVSLFFEPYDDPIKRGVKIEFKDVRYFTLDGNFFTEYCNDLEEMGYKDPEDADMDWLLDEDEYDDGAHFVIRFGNDACLRIGSADVMAEIMPPSVTALRTQ